MSSAEGDSRGRNSVGGNISFSHSKGAILTAAGTGASPAVSPHNQGCLVKVELHTCLVLGILGE